MFEYEEAGRRRRWPLVVFISVAVVVLLTGAGFVVTSLTGHSARPKTVEPVAAAAEPLSPGSPDVSAAPTPSATSASPAPSRMPSKKPSAKPSHIVLPPKQTVLPPVPAPAPTKSGCTTQFFGPNATKADVRHQLDLAGQKHFSASIPDLAIPTKLLYAIAFQESSWRSAVLACDGGIGLMQLMPQTWPWLNGVYNTGYDVKSLEGNAMLGTEFLSWLTKYFGEQLPDSHYKLDTEDTTLLDAVISAYNVGAGKVDLSKGDAGIINWDYVNSVKNYLNSCPCTAA